MWNILTVKCGDLTFPQSSEPKLYSLERDLNGVLTFGCDIKSGWGHSQKDESRHDPRFLRQDDVILCVPACFTVT